VTLTQFGHPVFFFICSQCKEEGQYKTASIAPQIILGSKQTLILHLGMVAIWLVDCNGYYPGNKHFCNCTMVFDTSTHELMT